ncbi:MAG: SPFH domain-containing protein [Candidatus Falkowbacteria bacterium]
MIIFTVIIVAVVGLASLFVFKSFGIMPPDKFGVKVMLGKPGKQVVKSDWYFAPWPVVKVVKITKKLMMFKFTVETAITGRGKIAGYEGIIEPIEINIECTIYAQFDEKEPSHIVQYSPGYSAESLGPFLVPYAIDTVRAMAGRLPWRLINRERRMSAVWIQSRLTGGPYYGIDDKDKGRIIDFKTDEDYGDPKKMPIIKAKKLDGKSPFVTLHMKNVSFVIDDITLTGDVKNSIIAPEKAQLDGQAKVIAAEAEKTRKIKEGEGDADARRKMLEAIKQDKDLEALAALKEIGKGPGNFIFALPEAVQKLLTKIGG